MRSDSTRAAGGTSLPATHTPAAPTTEIPSGDVIFEGYWRVRARRRETPFIGG